MAPENRVSCSHALVKACIFVRLGIFPVKLLPMTSKIVKAGRLLREEVRAPEIPLFPIWIRLTRRLPASHPKLVHTQGFGSDQLRFLDFRESLRANMVAVRPRLSVHQGNGTEQSKQHPHNLLQFFFFRSKISQLETKEEALIQTLSTLGYKPLKGTQRERKGKSSLPEIFFFFFFFHFPKEFVSIFQTNEIMGKPCKKQKDVMETLHQKKK